MNYVCQESDKLMRRLRSMLTPAQCLEIKDCLGDLILAVNSQNGRVKNFSDTVMAMRKNQKSYFKYAHVKDWAQASRFRSEARRYEDIVDKEAEEISTGVKQMQLF